MIGDRERYGEVHPAKDTILPVSIAGGNYLCRVKLPLFFLLFALAFALVWTYMPSMRTWQYVGYVRIAINACIVGTIVQLMVLVYRQRRKK